MTTWLLFAAYVAGGYLAIITLSLLWRLNLQMTLGAQLKEEARVNLEYTMLRQQCHYSKRLLDEMGDPAHAQAFYEGVRS